MSLVEQEEVTEPIRSCSRNPTIGGRNNTRAGQSAATHRARGDSNLRANDLGILDYWSFNRPETRTSRSVRRVVGLGSTIVAELGVAISGGQQRIGTKLICPDPKLDREGGEVKRSLGGLLNY